MTNGIGLPLAPQTKSFSGGFLLYRKVGAKLAKPGTKSQAHNPRFRHPSFAAAEAEAARLLDHHPGSTFIILQEVARVKLKPNETTVVPLHSAATDPRVIAFCDWLDTIPPSPPFHEQPGFEAFDDLTDEQIDEAQAEMRRRAAGNATEATALKTERDRRDGR